MRELLARFAGVVIAKLRRLVTNYTIVPREETDIVETWPETISRHALAAMLDRVTSWLEHYPWLQPGTSIHVRQDLDRLAEFLRTHQNGVVPT